MPAESEHSLMIEVARLTKERNDALQRKGVLGLEVMKERTRADAAESALAAARREQGELWELLREARLALVYWAETAEMPLLARIETALAAPASAAGEEKA